ncbi:MAG: NAD-dependent deacylase [Bacteroidetes bacterium]|jgi:NAD-dependent deacetylase|nr:NAD-dependent deacylase [Bacteroidota bacterium]
MKHVVVFTGAGISAESGIRTFRDSNGLWEEYRIEDVATPEAWQRNPAMVTTFYNERRKQVMEAKPNEAHLAISSLEEFFNVTVITQNVDDLHERAGSSKVLHLHGEIMKLRSIQDPSLIYKVKNWQVAHDAQNESGHQLRPHIVWFGEMVPKMDEAIYITKAADIFIIIGSSLEVYPAASLVEFAPTNAQKFLVDPHANDLQKTEDITVINKTAVQAVPALVKNLITSHV